MSFSRRRYPAPAKLLSTTALGLALITGSSFSDHTSAQAQEKKRELLGAASPMCLWMVFLASRDFRQRCGPAIDAATEQRGQRTLQIFDSYFLEYRFPASSSAYIAQLQKDGDKYVQCDNPDQVALSKSFDYLTDPPVIEKLSDELHQASGPEDGSCL